MKKSTILATAIAAVIAAPLASADTTVYGKAHMSLDNNDQADNWTTSSRSSRLGFKSSEYLGNGMKAMVQFEIGYDMDEGGAFGGARNSWVGLAGDFGQVRIGRHDTPAKSALYAAGNERIGDSAIDLHSSFGFSEYRSDDVIAYIAPKMGDLSISAAIIPGEGSGAGAGSNGNPGDGPMDAISLAVTYKAGGVKAAVGYTNGEDATGLSDATLLNIGGSYSISDTLNVGMQYQTVEAGTGGAGTVERTAMALTGEVGLGGGSSVVLMLGNAENDGGADADIMGLGFKKKLSKRTSTYVAYVDGDENNVLANPWVGNGGTTANGTILSVGLVHNF